MWSRAVVLVICLLFLALPAGASTPATFDLVGGLPLRAAGPADLTGHDLSTLLFQSSSGAFDASLQADRLRLVEVEYWEEVHDGPWSGHSGVRTDEHLLTDVQVALTDRLEGFTLLGWTEDGTAKSRVRGSAPTDAADPAWMADSSLRMFRLGGALQVSAPVARDAVDAGLRDQVLGRPLPFLFEVPEDSLHLHAADASHVLDGTLGLYLSGARFVVDHDQGRLDALATETVERRPGSVYLPEEGWVGPGEHEERIVRYVQAVAEEARLVVDTDAAPAALFSSGFDLDLEGHLAIPRAAGVVVLEDGTRPVETERLVVSGVVDVAVVPGTDAGTAELKGSGTVTYLRVGAEAERFAVGVAAVAGLAVLVAIGLTAWQQGLLMPLFSRVKRDDVLDHATRAVLYEAVKAEPGVTPHGLVERTGTGWSTVTYHLGILVRNELVVSVRDGRYRRYFDRSSGRFANGRKQVVSVLKNQTSAEIAHYIRDHPGAAQRRLSERFSLAPSSIHWHVCRLVEVGLVTKERRGQVVALLPGPAWSDLGPDELVAAPPRRDAASDVSA